ncbi:MAG: NADH:ubiquinone oxidoreductase [Ignisphaera sp.]
MQVQQIRSDENFDREILEKALQRLRKSIWVFHLNTGSCNGCDIEILDVLTPWFDVERFGIKLVASPRHADVILLTGPITIKTLPRLIKALKGVPRPRLILAIGSCAVGGNIWFESYSTIGGFPKIIDMLSELGITIDKTVFIPGCPARPEAIIYGVAVLLGLIEQKSRYKRVKA